MSSIVLKDWYQLDFTIKNPIEDLRKIDSIMGNLIREKLITKWFFLYEETTIRVRMGSNDKNTLKKRLFELINSAGLTPDSKLPFSDYAESEGDFNNEQVVERFANIMSEITQLTIKKIRKQINYDTYRIMERTSHCLFNNMGGLALKREGYFLAQRLKEKTGQSFDGDFENKIIEKKGA